MPDYMMIVHENERDQERMAPAETQRLVEQRAAYVERLRALGAYRDSERLRPSVEGKRVRTRDGGGVAVERGPFVDADRAVAAYYVIRAESIPAAVALAEQCPLAPGDALDVRPLIKGDVRADKTSRQGKTFAFAVLGNAANEGAWTAIMDRIDADTHDRFPVERFAGGVRLEAPGRGRQIVSPAGKRAAFDGPFLESKEVIGGVFFLRMASLDEAVSWASETQFVAHGALEIRELWRS